MTSEPKIRSAVEILLAVESQMHMLVQMHKNLDLNVKIISNKLNKLIDNNIIELQNYSNNSLPTNSLYEFPEEPIIELEKSPNGFKRVSRPETYDNSEPKFQSANQIFTPSEPDNNHINMGQESRHAVMQRVVDKNSKAVFYADVEIINLATQQTEIKTRTGSTGKWQASLASGKYIVKIRKPGPAKEKIEIVQDITIDGSSNNLPMVILK